MQKADTVVGQVCVQWSPSPGLEESLEVRTPADRQAVLCPGWIAGVACYRQHAGFEAWAPLSVSQHCEHRRMRRNTIYVYIK